MYVLSGVGRNLRDQSDRLTMAERIPVIVDKRDCKPQEVNEDRTRVDPSWQESYAVEYVFACERWNLSTLASSASLLIL